MQVRAEPSRAELRTQGTGCARPWRRDPGAADLAAVRFLRHQRFCTASVALDNHFASRRTPSNSTVSKKFRRIGGWPAQRSQQPHCNQDGQFVRLKAE